MISAAGAGSRWGVVRAPGWVPDGRSASTSTSSALQSIRFLLARYQKLDLLGDRVCGAPPFSTRSTIASSRPVQRSRSSSALPSHPRKRSIRPPVTIFRTEAPVSSTPRGRRLLFFGGAASEALESTNAVAAFGLDSLSWSDVVPATRISKSYFYDDVLLWDSKRAAAAKPAPAIASVRAAADTRSSRLPLTAESRPPT